MESKKRKGLGKTGSKLLSLLSSKNNEEVFTIKEAKDISRIKGPTLRKLLFDMERNGWIERIERGKYLIHPLDAGLGTHRTHPFIIARKMVKPYYIGFLSALNHHGVSAQVSRTVFIATTKKKRSLSFQSQEFRFVVLDKKRFFGFEEEWVGNMKFNISELEKTVVDCLFLPEYGGGLSEVIKAFGEKMDYEKLCDYAIKMDDVSIVKRLGYILDALAIDTPAKEKLLKNVSGSYCPLDSTIGKSGKKNAKWRIIENVSNDELQVEL